jgi:hypothetical protein
MHFLFWYLWTAPHLFLSVFLWIFLSRSLHKQSPVFCAYVLCELTQFVVLITLSLYGIWHPGHFLNFYRWILVWSSGVVSLLNFGVIYELVNQMILSRSSLGETLRPVMQWSAAILVLLTAVAAAHLGIAVERVVSVFEVLDFSTSVLQVGLLLVLFIFSRALLVSWRSLPAGIALGLGILGCVELSAAPLFSTFPHRYVVIDVVRMTGFHICVLVWLAYLIFPDRGPKFGGRAPQESDLESWDKELQRMVRR